MFKGDSPAAAEIEAMIDHYISLKTYLSFATGCLVAVMLMLCGIQMAVLFGIIMIAAASKGQRMSWRMATTVPPTICSGTFRWRER